MTLISDDEKKIQLFEYKRKVQEEMKKIFIGK